MALSKILVANRGEIACRIIRAARKLGKSTVSVYSKVDADSLHVRMADEAVEVGPAPAAKSYLNIPNIIKAAKSTGSQAVHPGYGFLSENGAFVSALERENIAFIGPDSKAMKAMGDKIGSKQIAKEAGVNTVPGFIGTIDSADHAVSVAEEIGYPVMVKASAGGGGKGMRVAWNKTETIEAYKLCSGEAQASFADGRLLIEKFVEKPRHVEIQIMGDKHGNVLYFPERECSIQRRNQKIFEEAPSPLVDGPLRRKMGEQAVALAKKVGYFSAGTVEFLVSETDRSFYFLEMNTRLQVEHPITEAISGTDLMEMMFAVADGEKLSLRQGDISPVGWAMESRIYAEDPRQGFVPFPGAVRAYREPRLRPDPEIPSTIQELHFDHAGVRVDSGIDEGGKVQLYYDPMVSKLVCYGQDRETTRQKMVRALDSYVIYGVKNNLEFLRALMSEPAFIAGKTTTAFIDQTWKNGFHGAPKEKAAQRRAEALAVWMYARSAGDSGRISVRSGDEEVEAEIKASNVIFLDGEEREVMHIDKVQETICGGGVVNLVEAVVNQKPELFQILGRERKGWGVTEIIHDGIPWRMNIRPKSVANLEEFCATEVDEHAGDSIRAPMPGSVTSVLISDGDKVEPQQELLVLEAMKMQNILRSDKRAEVKKVHCQPGDVVSHDSLLIEFMDSQPGT
ncbi:hypothetical protein NDN08_007890 [Rhodosorus marinus]|uniref:Propionyl-CoA carboxylase alpha chain, mitochondrial n=1 Tax=Rhodosorus marinus TaxID=101924 RepID=A0AAV8V1N1_9RHOD|nr:hypothetical protein NDN08_007890 [Rhodosorus marinus]